MLKSHPYAFSGRVGVARRDITPPAGIHARNWGAATHEAATGVHRPLTCTVIAILAEEGDNPLLIAGLDLGWFKSPTDEFILRGPVLKRLGLDPARVVINLSHTHSGPSICTIDADRPGGHLIRPYLDHVAEMLVEAGREAILTAASATIDWKYGNCALATNRDLVLPGDPPQMVVGFNPDAPTDTTLLMGRVARHDGSLLATIANFACHPTTLGSANSLISPDYVGALRETVEADTGVPLLFLQGASGDIAPAHQYTGDVAVADRHGRCVAHAVLSILNAMPPAGSALRFDGVVESGATLAQWTLAAQPTDVTLHAEMTHFPLPLKPQPSLSSLQQQLDECTDNPQRERLRRRMSIVRFVGSQQTCDMPLWAWRIGGALLFFQPNEMYSDWQIALRSRWPGRPVVVTNLSNGSCGYVLPRPKCKDSLYSFWQSPFDQGSYETVERLSMAAGERLVGEILGDQ
jgi:hypothetical protein